MNGVPLQRVDEISDLGIIITSSLSWNNHIDNIISKAARISGLIKRTFGWHASSQTKYIMYCSIVRIVSNYDVDVNDLFSLTVDAPLIARLILDFL